MRKVLAHVPVLRCRSQRSWLLLCLGICLGLVIPGWSLASEEPEDPDGATDPSAEAVTSSEITIAGSRLSFLEGGDPRALTVLFLHGGRFTSQTWKELGTLDLLVRRGYRILALDLPGYGRSEKSEKLPPSDVLASFVTLVAQQPVVVVSPSMSGRYSFPFLVRRPSQIAGFVAVAPVEIATYSERLEGSEVPTLLVWGENDEVIPVRESKTLLEAMGRSRRVVLEGASHACYLDRPIDFHRELLQFLAGLGH